ncbi:MAG: hypothetical protein N3G75_03960 [Methanothrix sp.]|nr:hypothetical protein [Methanothrix sp.]MCX8206970.1 hypothetical protein [Methanothrix sp.]
MSEIQQRVVGWWLGNYYGSIGYVGKRLGKKGVREFLELGARQVAATFKRLDLTEPLDVAVAIATNEKNMFGSEIEVKESDGCVDIYRERCAILEGARAFSRLGASLIAKEHCRTCSEVHWKSAFREMGMSLETELSENGCRMRVRKL